MQSPDLAPAVPTEQAILTAAAAAPALRSYVADMGWMHPLYAPLRKAAESQEYSSTARPAAGQPGPPARDCRPQPAERYVLVDAAGARLWMYENGRPVDSMKVVVGKVDNQTPMLAGLIR
jgi:murein L,D-transpeptidase YcbB/YkuD